MRKLIHNGFLVLFLVFSTLATAQVKEITGKIKDEAGKGLPGASIIVKGTSIGTSSDLNGDFSISADQNSTLLFTFMGYQTVEVKVGNQTTFDISLSPDSKALDDVVVVAYGTQKKEAVTSSITTVKAAELTDVTAPNVSTLLQGKAAGVQVVTSSGAPGAEAAILIRGAASLNKNVSPLWVVDGVIQHSTPVINPNDIETTSILKDASATSLYGSRGANGVIIVTTKRAKNGSNSVSFSAKTGVNQFNQGGFQVMNSQQLYDYHKLMNNSQEWFTEDLLDRDYNWIDGSTQNALVNDYNISYALGNDKVNTYISGGYYSEEGTVKGSEFDRYTFRMNNDFMVNNWLTLKPKMSMSYEKGFNQGHDRYSMYTYLPWDRPIDDDGNVINAREERSWISRDQGNYYYDLQWNYGKWASFNTSFNGDFDIKLTKNLTYSSINNFTFMNLRSMSYIDPQSLSGTANKGEIENETKNRTTRLFTQMLRYNKAFGNHDINAIAGYEYNDYIYESTNTGGKGIIPGTTILDVASSPQFVEGKKNEYALQSMFFDASYAYDNRYFLKGSIRRDGASNFGPENQYGTFYSLGAGWTISNEKFFNIEQIDLLKLRVSNGAVGNRPESLYPWQNTYAVGLQYSGIPAISASQYGNPDLTWEKSIETNFAVDARLFNRINLTAEYYNKNTADLLYFVSLPSISGYKGYWENVGSLVNKGYEFTIDADILKGDFKWNLAFNIGKNINSITGLFDEREMVPHGSKVFKLDEDMNTWYMRKWTGVDPDTGAPQWEVRDEETGEVSETNDYNAATLQMVGSATPDFIGGFASNMSYKGFSLGMTFSYVKGGLAYNGYRSLYDSDGAYPTYNQQVLAEGWSRWEKPGDIATHPQAIYGGNSLSNKQSSRYLEDRSYLKLRNITLSYTMPNNLMQSIGVKSSKIYIAGDNLLTFTKFTGMDPETVKIDGNFDNAPYPTPKRFVVGLNLSL